MSARAALLIAVCVCLALAGTSVVRAAWLPWSDNPQAPNASIRDDHINELRNNVNDLEQNAVNLICRQIPITNWPEPVVPGQTPIRASHINEIRDAIVDIRAACMAVPACAAAGGNAVVVPPAVAVGQTIQGSHITDLRTALDLLRIPCGVVACTANGGGCAAPAECCSGICNIGVCEPAACLPDGSPCAAPGDCCSNNCPAGSCEPIACADETEPCGGINPPCCGALTCAGGLCWSCPFPDECSLGQTDPDGCPLGTCVHCDVQVFDAPCNDWHNEWGSQCGGC